MISIPIDASRMSKAEEFSRLPEADQVRVLEKILADGNRESFWKNWDFWGRPEQQLPDHDNWDVLFWMAGRGGGKTRPGAEAVNKMAENKNWMMALIGETAAEVRDVMIEGPSGILATCHGFNPAVYYPSKRRVVWPKTGSWAVAYSGDEPDQLRGANLNFCWIDELAKFKYPDETWDQVELGLRAGDHPQCVISSTPRPIKLIRTLMEEPRTIIRTWATYRNAANLAPTFLKRILDRYEGTRVGRQEIHAEILEDVEGALWRLSKIEELRINVAPAFSRIAIGVDPPTSVGGECGIIAMGLCGQDLYCIDDMSCSGTPEEWGDAVAECFHKHDADIVVAETNQGGDMVVSTIKAGDNSVPVKKVHASRGKRTRAEPISMYTEKDAVHHVGAFADLETELTTWVPGDDSPNRLDAYVHAATYLMEFTNSRPRRKRARALGADA